VQPTGSDASGSMIVLDRVRKQYADGTVAVNELSLDVAAGQIAVLVGPSGCGKTTTMRMINRLVEPSSGRIYLDGDDIGTVDRVQLRRRIGYVIQQVGLFPHQTVADNIATVPQLLGWDKKRTRSRVSELLDLVGLEADRHAKRYPHELSGGQRQRVGVARALAADPPVLLMDEPFGAVDPIARDRLQAEFLRLQEQVRKTVVFVTHDMDEAIRLGDRVAVLRQGGVLEQYDDPAVLLTSPATDFVAEFVGARRTLRRLSVISVASADLHNWATVDVDEMAAGAFAGAGGDWRVVVDSGRPIGVISRTDANDEVSVRERMQRLSPVSADASLEFALAALLSTGVPGLPVIKDSRYVGVATSESIVQAARGAENSTAREP